MDLGVGVAHSMLGEAIRSNSKSRFSKQVAVQVRKFAIAVPGVSKPIWKSMDGGGDDLVQTALHTIQRYALVITTFDV